MKKNEETTQISRCPLHGLEHDVCGVMVVSDKWSKMHSTLYLFIYLFGLFSGTGEQWVLLGDMNLRIMLNRMSQKRILN